MLKKKSDQLHSHNFVISIFPIYKYGQGQIFTFQKHIIHVVSNSPQDIVNEITDSDLFRFKWRILKHMCKMCDKYETFLKTELFYQTDLKDILMNVTAKIPSW